MSGFTAEWLALREPVDAAARNTEVTAAVQTWRQRHDPLTVLDLACGAGANVRFLAPLLGGEQHWRLVDHDPVLLARGQALTARWATPPGLNLALDWRAADLAADWARLDFRDRRLVTASALLDLVSADWLERLARRCGEVGAAVCIVLSYDGTLGWEPALAGDESVRGQVNRHQRTDKGLGSALGPDAATTLAILLRRLGYTVRLRPSPWNLGPEQGAMQTALLEGWGAAIRELAPHLQEALAAWQAQRCRWIERGESRLRVGHWDLFAGRNAF